MLGDITSSCVVDGYCLFCGVAKLYKAVARAVLIKVLSPFFCVCVRVCLVLVMDAATSVDQLKSYKIKSKELSEQNVETFSTANVSVLGLEEVLADWASYERNSYKSSRWCVECLLL